MKEWITATIRAYDIPMIPSETFITENKKSIIEKLKNKFLTEDYEIGKISISKYILQNIDIDITNIQQKEFKEHYDDITAEMKKIKDSKEKKLIIKYKKK